MADLIAMLGAAAGAAAGGGEVDPYFNQTTLLLHGDGTNGAQNNTFLDSSSNTFTITRNGNTTQGTFSPFSLAEGQWSNYFNGAGGINFPNTDFAISSGTQFTIECWFNASNLTANYQTIWTTYQGPSGLLIYLRNTGVLEYFYNGNNMFSGVIPITPGQWYHVALCGTSGTSIKAFVNGVQDGSTQVVTAVNSGTSYPAGIGYLTYNGGNPFTGYVSNFSILIGTVKYTSDFTPSTTPLEVGTTNQKILTCTSNRFVDTNTATTAKTISLSSSPSVQPFSPFAPSAAYSPSVNGGSGYFDGSGDYLQIGSTTSVPTTGDFTVSFWMYNTSTSTDKTVITLNGRNTSYSAVRVDNKGTSGLSLYMSTDGSGWQINSGNIGTSTLNRWSFISVVRDGGTIRVYQNGTQVYTSTAIGSGTALLTGTAGYSYVGAVYFSGVINNYFGYVSNIRVEASALYPSGTTFTPPTAPLSPTGSRLCLDFTNAGIFDSTAKNDLETVGNAQVDTSVVKYGTGSIKFDGTGDYLEIADNPNLQFGTGPFTIEGWLYANTLGVSGIVCKGTSATDGWNLRINSSNKLELQYNASSVITSSASLTTGSFIHVCVVREGTGTNQTKLYINGTNDGTGTVSADFNQTVNMLIGVQRNRSDSLDGYIDDLRITKGVARYTTTFTPPSRAFPDL